MRSLLAFVVPSLLLVACISAGGDDEAHRGGAGSCFVGGCSSQLCTDQTDIGSDCEWREAYACYRDATCERQADATCGWTPTPALDACLASH